MGKTKHWLCIAALMLALAPAAWADEPNALATFIEDLIAQVVAAVTGLPADGLGVQVPVNGAPENQPEIGIHVPIGG